MGGLIDNGQLTVTLDFVPGSTSETHILAAIADPDARRVRFTFPNAVIVSFRLRADRLQARRPARRQDERHRHRPDLRLPITVD
jgi:hypothetical protein